VRPKKVVLCVDDDEQALSVLAYLLHVNGFRVLSATSGKQAITLFAANQVDLVLTDHLMPRMNGDELVVKLKGMSAYIPMVILGDPHKMKATFTVQTRCWQRRSARPQRTDRAREDHERAQTRTTEGCGSRGATCDRETGNSMNVSAFNPIPLRVSMLCVDCECISAAAASCACGSTHTMLLAPVLNRPQGAAKALPFRRRVGTRVGPQIYDRHAGSGGGAKSN
jgi:CheY-like chemotaxis protein